MWVVGEDHPISDDPMLHLEPDWAVPGMNVRIDRRSYIVDSVEPERIWIRTGGQSARCRQLATGKQSADSPDAPAMMAGDKVVNCVKSGVKRFLERATATFVGVCR